MAKRVYKVREPSHEERVQTAMALIHNAKKHLTLMQGAMESLLKHGYEGEPANEESIGRAQRAVDNAREELASNEATLNELTANAPQG